jgi:hypothetical protein
MTDKADAKQAMEVGWYVVAWLDILGQREELRRMRRLPLDADAGDRAAFVEQIRRTFGVVEGVTRTLETYFGELGQEGCALSELPPAQRVEARGLMNHGLSWRRYGDGLVAWAPLHGCFDMYPAGGLWALLIACAGVMLLWLAEGTPIRGGIDVGLGAELCPGEIYGACVAGAYELESEVAQYPRVAVGASLVSFLRWLRESPEEGKLRALNRATAESCLGLLAQDVDGQTVLDYMGTGFRQVAGESIGGDVAARAYRFAEAECRRWLDAGNSKLAKRYHLLRAYMGQRLGLWVRNPPAGDPGGGTSAAPRPA